MNYTYPQLLNMFPDVSPFYNRRRLTKAAYVTTLIQKGKTVPETASSDVTTSDEDTTSESTPLLVLQNVNALRSNDHSDISSDFPPNVTLRSGVSHYQQFYSELYSRYSITKGICSVCSTMFPLPDNNTTLTTIAIAEFPNLHLLQYKPLVFYPDTLSPSVVHPKDFSEFLQFDITQLSNHWLNKDGFVNSVTVNICKRCIESLHANKLPPLSIANHLFFPKVELPSLNFIERQCISRIKLTSCIVKLTKAQNSMLGLKGHYIALPQNPDRLLSVLPPASPDILSAIHIIFVKPKTSIGNSNTPQFNFTTCKQLFTVRRPVVSAWLLWLKENNPHYVDVSISEESLVTLPNNDILPGIEELLTEVNDTHSADYIAENGPIPASSSSLIGDITDLQSSAIFDEKGSTLSVNELYGGILEELVNSVPQSQLSVIQNSIAMVSGTQPIRPSHQNYYIYAFPFLFPYGVCDPNFKRPKRVSFQAIVKHLLTHSNNAYRSCPNFIFSCYDKILKSQLFSALRIKIKGLDPVSVNSINSITINDVINARSSMNDPSTNYSDYIKHSRLLSNKIPFHQNYKSINRSELKSCIAYHGHPSFYITISPSEVHHPFAFFTCSEFPTFDLDNPPPDMSNSYIRNKIAANNPVRVAHFFHKLISTIFKHLFGASNENKIGIFGPLQSYYGMVECQNRGTLHIHLLLWVQGQPDYGKLHCLLDDNSQFRAELLQYLESTITTDDTLFGPDLRASSTNNTSSSYFPLVNPSNENFLSEFSHRVLDGIKDVQTHTHSPSCYKYNTNGSKTCRYRKPEIRYMHTEYNEEIGKINLRKFDPMVNNFNPWIFLATQSNSDIQYLFHGMSTNAIVHYITNYVTKSSIGVDSEFVISQAAIKKSLESPLQTTSNYSPQQQRTYDLLLRFHMSLQSHCQVSSTEIVTKLLGLPMTYKLDEYESLYMYNLCDRYRSFLINTDSVPSMYLDRFGNHLFNSDIDYINRPPNLSDWNLYDFKRHLLKCPFAEKHFAFQDLHPQHLTHGLKMREKPVIPNLLCNIPRFDDEDVTTIFTFKHFVTLLFQPWRVFSDLDYESFIEAAPEYIKRYIDNIKSLQKSKDDAKRYRLMIQEINDNLLAQPFNDVTLDNVHFDENDFDLNPNSWESYVTPEDLSEEAFSHKVNSSDSLLASFLNTFAIESTSTNDEHNLTFPTNGDYSSTYLQTLKSALKNLNSTPIEDISVTPSAGPSNSSLVDPPSPTVVPTTSIQDVLTQTLADIDTSFDDTIIQTPFTVQATPALVNTIIDKFSLNEKQTEAFRLVTDSIIEQTAITAVILGEGGTGKTRVINAIQEFLKVSKLSHTLKLLAPTGVAAFQISGSTIHRALSLQRNKRKVPTATIRSNVSTDWANILILIIDEISMMAVELLEKLDAFLREVTGREDIPYGGITVVFLGDFYQHPPVGGGSILYHKGWLESLTDSVILTEQMRAADDPVYVNFLSKVRNKQVLESDLMYLNQRLMANLFHDNSCTINIDDWLEAPIITPLNSTVHLINQFRITQLAKKK